MKHISAILWIFPAAVHIAYILATYSKLPPSIGVGPGSAGTTTSFFVVEWFAVVGLASLIFAAIHIRLPKLSDRMLSVPGKQYWLSTEETRAELVERLRGFCETTLLMLNIFFLAVYQIIYQTNVRQPFISIPSNILVLGFMVAPMILVAAAFLNQMRLLALKSRKAVDDKS